MIIGLPQNYSQVRVPDDPGLWPKCRIIWTMVKIGTEVNFLSLHRWEPNSILVGSCIDKVFDNHYNLSIKQTKRYYGGSAQQ